MINMHIEVYYFIWICLIGLLFKCWSNLKLSILNFSEYQIHRRKRDDNKRVTNIIEISVVFLLIISLICFSFFIKKTENIIRIIVFLLISLILTYLLTLFFNVLNMKLQKKDWAIKKDMSYNDFLSTLEKELSKKHEEDKKNLHKKMNDLKEKIKEKSDFKE